MAEKRSWTRSIAKAISNVLHPYVILSLVIAFAAYETSPSTGIWAKWTVVTLLSAYLFPVSYMQIKASTSARATGAQISLRSFFREQPNEMLILACLFGIPSVLIPYVLGSPPGIIAVMVGVAATSLLIALVNRIYRASFHLALLTSMAVSLAAIFNLSALALAPLIVLLGIARYHLREHTPMQLLMGFLIGLLVTGAVARGFGFPLIG